MRRRLACSCIILMHTLTVGLQLLKTWMREHPNYADVQAIDLWAPAGPWSATKPGKSYIMQACIQRGILNFIVSIDDWTQHPNFITAGEMSRDNMIVSTCLFSPIGIGLIVC